MSKPCDDGKCSLRKHSPLGAFKWPQEEEEELCWLSEITPHLTLWGSLTPDEVFRVKIQPHTHRVTHTPDFPLLPSISDPAGIHMVPERMSSDVVPRNRGDLWLDHGHEWSCDFDCRASTQLFLLVMLSGLCHRFLSAAFWMHCASPWVLPLCMTFLPPQQSSVKNSLLGAKLAVQFISPTKVKSDLGHCFLHWNDWNKPPPTRFCQICCRVGSLRQMDGMNSKEMAISYTPQQNSLGYICQYLTPTESAISSHPKYPLKRILKKINHITWKWQIQLSLKKEKTSPKRQWIQPSCAAWLVQRYLYHYHKDWEMNGD